MGKTTIQLLYVQVGRKANNYVKEVIRSQGIACGKCRAVQRKEMRGKQAGNDRVDIR